MTVPQKFATAEEYFLIEENCLAKDVSDKLSQGDKNSIKFGYCRIYSSAVFLESGKTKIDEPFVVTDSSDHTVTAAVPCVNEVSNTEPNSYDVGASNKSKKTVASAPPKERNRKKRRLSVRCGLLF